MTNVLPISSNILDTGELAINGVSISSLAKTYGTPLYVLDHATIAHQVSQYHLGLSGISEYQITYACKANLTRGLAKELNAMGVGFDVVSSGELKTVLSAGVPNDKIIFHGNNKSIAELTLAITHSIRLMVDNFTELEKINDICTSLSTSAHILLRLKPGVDTNTHAYIKTGQNDSKFGIDDDLLPKIATYIQANPRLIFLGIHAHIGSQITELAPYLKLVDVMTEYLKKFQNDFQLPIKELDLGGGFGVAYTDQDISPNVAQFLKDLMAKLKENCTKNNIDIPKIIVEPGRSLIAQSGVTIYTVGTVKEIPNVKTYVFIDGGMADNMRPALYQSKYTFEVGNRMTTPKTMSYSIAGKYCETGDILAENIMLPPVSVNDTIVVATTGAYNYAMASTYNRVGRPGMVLIKEGKVIALLNRETDEDLLRLDH